MANATAQLTPDPKNANTGTVRGLGMVERSLQQYGAGRSILASRDGIILAGNKTYDRAVELGIPVREIESDGTTLFVIKRTDLDYDDPRARELAIADNRTSEVGLEWDTDVLTALAEDGVDLSQFWLEDELADLLGDGDVGTEGLTDPDAVPDPPDEPITKPGDVWLMGEHRLLCGDATNMAHVDQLRAGHKADMVWTDPPYGVAVGDKNARLDAMSPGSSHRVTRNLKNDTVDEDGLRRLLREAFANTYAVCTAGAVWHVAAPPGPLHIVFGEELNRLGLWRQTIQWVKNNSTFSPMGVDYHWQAEPIFHGWVPGAKHQYFGDRTQTTVWHVDRPTASPDHPTMKPVALVERALENHTKSRQIILDPFAGSGTTFLASEHLGRICYGMEIDPTYCDVIVRRWEDFTGKTATREAAAEAAD